MQDNPISSNNFSVGRKQLYILPTKIGWYFALLLVALFGIAVKFDNQAAFMMLFILVGIGNAVMLSTHNNVIRLELEMGSVAHCFATQHVKANLRITNPTRRARYAIYVACGDHTQVIDLAAHDSKSLTLEIMAPERGRLELEPVILSSQYPAGLFFCWTKRSYFAASAIVYPEPVDLVDLTISQHEGQHEIDRGAEVISQGDFRGLRHFQEGDRLRDVHWPALAKTNKLITKEYDTPSVSQHSFVWEDLPQHLSTENKLSQLSYWINRADSQGVRFSLSLPTASFVLNEGPSHKHDCLSALALFPKDEPSKRQARSAMTNRSWVSGLLRRKAKRPSV